ncbi:hypothetical protein [Paenibacillus sp. FSL H8-0537]|uniref:hypothetical protein n=1 Tax=Paenibacillus sp. FSL H8-0537 TaxID=2921399 RepID=UPI00310111D6
MLIEQSLKLQGEWAFYSQELLAEVCVVGQNKSSVPAHLATKLVFFQPENDSVELVMQVANIQHKRGGIIKYMELGAVIR